MIFIYKSASNHNISTGNGPIRAVLRAGVHKIIERFPIFGLRGDFYHPIFFPVMSSCRTNAFWIAGVWSAIHMMMLHLAPDPISPWLLYAAACGRDGFPTDIGYIRALDPFSATVLEPWFSFNATDTLGDDMTGPIQQLLIAYLELPEVRCLCRI